MNWEEYQLGDILSIKHGYAFKGEFFTDIPNSNILVTPSNFNIGGGFKDGKLKFYDGDIPPAFVLNPEDVIVTMTDLSKLADTLGFSAVVPNDGKTYLHNQRIGLVELKDRSFGLGYLYWLLRSEGYQRFIAGSASGATVKHTSPSRIYAYKFKAPSEPEARQKIARILFCYDNLIENNLKRIKLLEELAQLTYEQWFIRREFPGYESTPVDPETGLPREWDKKKLGDLITLNYGKALKADERHGGNVPVFGSSGEVGFHSESIVQGPGIIVGRKGTIGSVFWSDSDFYPIDTAFYVTSKMPLIYVYYQLQYVEFINSDAAVPGLNRNSAYLMGCNIPPMKLMDKFSDSVKPLFASIKVLREQSQLLKEAREILLPRLMTGMIDIDQVQLPESLLTTEAA